MKTNRTVKPRRVYPDALRQEAVRLVIEVQQSFHAVARMYELDHSSIRDWVHLYKLHGVYRVKAYRNGLCVTDDFKLSVVQNLLKNELSLEAVAYKYGLSSSTVSTWVNQYKAHGCFIRKDRNCSKNKSMKTRKPKKIEKVSDVELQKELTYLRAENAYLKKLRVLVQERIAREDKSNAKPSKN
jgi:transposase